MKSKSKQHNNSLKLPQIGNRTMDKFDNNQKEKPKQRPNSSKNILVDLEKKLFSQLNSFQQTGTTKSKTIRSKKHIQGSKELKNQQTDIGMNKIAQLMPDLYSKIIECKKYDNLESQNQYSHTLKEKNMSNFKELNLSEDLILDFNQLKKQKVPEISTKNQNKINETTTKKTIKKQKPSQQKPIATASKDSTLTSNLINQNSNSITSNVNKIKIQKEDQQVQLISPSQFEQGEEQKIYQAYLNNEGLSKETSLFELRRINEDLKSQEVDIEQLQSSYSNLMKTLGYLCIDDNN